MTHVEGDTEDQRFVDTDHWRRHIDEKVKELGDKVTLLTSNVSSALTIHASNAQQISDNTRITLDLKESLDRFQIRAMPAVEVTETMQRGAVAVGRTLEFIAKWARRIWKTMLFFAGAWIAIKLVMAGGTWSDAVKAFFLAQSH